MDLSSLIRETIEKHAESYEERPYIGASSIGNACDRSIWYSFNRTVGKKHSARELINFEIGHKLESLFMEYMGLSGIKVIRPAPENNYLLCIDEDVDFFQGHADAIIEFSTGEQCVLEFKTAKNSSWSKFKKDGLRNWSNNYYCQLQTYMGMFKIQLGVLLAINKDTSELHHEYVRFDEELYRKLRDKAYYISSMQEPPERINKNASFLICSMCRYKDICHPKQEIKSCLT